jgi:hypothetical protein
MFAFVSEFKTKHREAIVLFPMSTNWHCEQKQLKSVIYIVSILNRESSGI